MGALFDALIPRLRDAFPDRGMEVVGVPPEYVRIPALHQDVGDIQIYDDDDELTVFYGNFTHCHYGALTAHSDQWIAEAVNDVISDLTELFEDRMKLWGSHKTSGGVVRVGDKPSAIFGPRGQQYLWSGPVDDAA
jgi:hypothetical protein